MSQFKFFIFDKDNRAEDQLNVVFHKFREELSRDLYVLDPGSNLEMSPTFKNSLSRYAEIKTTLGINEVNIKVHHRASENRLNAYQESS
ncbi:MAG TPA: hypothetical protein VED85_04865 [Burkholderiaceae bacterium]|nr:hypothetical protein [Burkholderiaceae bacterium]